MFQPRPRYFRKPNRKLIRNTYENKSNQLSFGILGVQALEKGFLTISQLEAVRRTIVSRLKRRGKVWIRAFPDYPRTAKPKEVRMGRGKGAVDHWSCIVKPGKILFEAASKDKLALRAALAHSLRKFPIYVKIVDRISRILYVSSYSSFSSLWNNSCWISRSLDWWARLCFHCYSRCFSSFYFFLRCLF